MEKRTQTIRDALKQHYEQRGESELSQAEISKIVRPKLKEAYSDEIRYTMHIMEALTELKKEGDIRAISSGGYRLVFNSDHKTSEPESENKTTSRSQSASEQDHSNRNGEDTEPQSSTEMNKHRSSELETQSLFELVRSCQMGEAGAIVGGHIDRNDLREALYVETGEDELVTNFFADEYERDGRCLVITGSAGDGKSALLSRAFQEAQGTNSDIEQSHIHMDATASQGKHQAYEETLKNFLDAVSTCLEAGSGPRTGLAINLGLAIDFFERQEQKCEYPKIWESIDNTRDKKINETEEVVTLNLGHRSTYQYTPEDIGSGLLRTIVEKFAFDDPKSPFHSAYKRSTEYCSDPSRCPLHYNVELFTDSDIRGTIARLIAASGLMNNVYLNPRAILDLIAKMIIPDSLQGVNDTGTDCPVRDAISRGKKFDSSVLLANSVFERLATHEDRSRSYLDPAAQAGLKIDEQILEWGADPRVLDEGLRDIPLWDEYLPEDKIRTKLRLERLTANSNTQSDQYLTWFDQFTGALTFFDPPDNVDSDQYKTQASDVVDTVTAALKGWTGSGTGEDWVEFVDGIKQEYTFLSKWENPKPLLPKSRKQTKQEATPGQLWIVLDPGKGSRDDAISVPVTFDLYVLMKRIRRGYSPNARDIERSEGIRLLSSRLSEFTNKQETVQISNSAGEQILNINRDAFGTVQVEAGSDI